MTTKLIRPVFILYALFSCIFLAKGQNVEVKVSAPDVVEVNEAFQLVYTLNEKPTGFQKPDLREFLFSGPQQGSQFSSSWVNGKQTRSSKFTYTFVVQGQKAGKFKITPAKFVVNGKTISSKAVSIEVVGSGGSAKASANGKKKTPGSVSDEDLFVRVELSKRSVYKDEPVVANVKIYTRVDIAGFQNIKIPSFTGFWSQEIKTPNHLNLKRQNINGRIYNVGLIKKSLLFPQREGKLKIDPVELDVVVTYRTRPSSFWDDGYRRASKKIKSKPYTINVKGLPSPRPESFTGAVGTFRISSSVDKNKLKTNDAITLKLQVAGSGNLRLIKAPKIKFPPDFDVFEPKETQNIKTSEAGSSGSKTFEYVLIPRHRGSFTIPAVELSYFDVRAKGYKTITTEEHPIEVEKGEGEETIVASTTVRKGGDKVKVIQQDIRYIKTENIDLKVKGDSLFNSLTHWLFFILTSVAFGAFVAFQQKKIKQNKNLALVRNKRASKVSQKRLKQAKVFMDTNEKEQFFEEVLRATWGYIGDKLTIDVAELSKDSIKDELGKHSIDDNLIERLLKVMDTCEFARFAPVNDTEIGNTFKEASEIINTLDSQL